MLLCKIFGMIFQNDCLLSTICVLNRQEANVRLSTAAHLLAESASPFFVTFLTAEKLNVWTHQIVNDFFNVLKKGDMF